MALNEELLNKFTQNERGDLYFAGKLLLQLDTTAPEKVTNLEAVEITPSSIKVSFTPSISEDVEFYEVYYTLPADGPIETINTVDSVVEFTDLQELTSYEVYVVVVDTSGNRSSTTYYDFVTPPANTEQAPVVSRAYIDNRMASDSFEIFFNFRNFFLAETIDVYFNDELVSTINGSSGTYYHGIPADRGYYTVKAVAKNQYGEATRSITGYWDY